MPFPKELLNAGEQVVLDLRPHWWYFARQAAALVVAILIAVISLVFLPAPVMLAAAVLLAGTLIWFGWHYIQWSSINFVVTTDRLIDRQGVFNRTGIEIPLERVNTVLFHQTLFERIIGSGDLVIESAAEQGSQPVPNIRKPLQVQNEIYRQMEANENRKFDRLGAVPQAQQQSIPEQIATLAELHRQGVLTDAEFQMKKQQLLDRL
ncbi:MAG: PH domain-containing protein [Acidimicrobiales bacterium]